MTLINSLLFPLLITILIECMVVFLLGYRERLIYVVVVLANMITNPLLNYLLILVSSLGYAGIYNYIILPLELIVIFSEWRVFCYILKAEQTKLFILSVSVNTVSYLLGLLVMWSL